MANPTEINSIDLPNESVAFDAEAFNEAIASHGAVFVHWQAIPDPLGLQGKFDARRPDGVNNTKAFNGHYYIKRGCLQAIITGANKEVKSHLGGQVDAGVASITVHTNYLNSDKKVYLTPYDRFYLEDEGILVPRGELVEASMDGLDRLQWPACEVIAIVDADGIEYTPDDYQIVGGYIQWVGNRPTFNVEANKGKVYSIKYLYKPFYYVERLLHELRLVQGEDAYGTRKLIRANQSAIVYREYVYQNKSLDAESPDQKGAIEQPTE